MTSLKVMANKELAKRHSIAVKHDLKQCREALRLIRRQIKQNGLRTVQIDRSIKDLTIIRDQYGKEFARFPGEDLANIGRLLVSNGATREFEPFSFNRTDWNGITRYNF